MEKPEPSESTRWQNGNTTIYALAALLGGLAALITAVNGCVPT
ncbi:hypothetical protein SAMN05444365_104209 [Micromonospora pattaloongensis]|uniref:Uncharacterized protein n=1 Tax=Micromonospora pattaloongensis TaxID=405436 RepID=A0A1H3NX00_9ACTN|nr:hypothetical protein [Micromonospora pattaloongensis]SDY93412.1 hypothetical protein SAMN05444365_104209 [Micromonospora pattaloongensis]